jgi:hypothetical protein
MSSPARRFRLGCWMVCEHAGQRHTLPPDSDAGRLVEQFAAEADVVVVGLDDGRAAWEATGLPYFAPPPPPPPTAPKRRLLAAGRDVYNRYVSARDPDRLFAKLRGKLGTAAAKAVVLLTSPLWVGVYAVEQLALATARVLVRSAKFVRRALKWRPPTPPPPPTPPVHPLAGLAHAAACDAWWLPSPDADAPADLPALLTVSHLPPADASIPTARAVRRTIELGRRAVLVGCFSEEVRTELVTRYGLPPEKVRVLPVDEPGEWLAVFRATGTRSVPATLPTARRLCLILPDVVFGGLLEATKDLVRGLVAVNAERRQLELSLAIPAAQIGADDFRALLPTEPLQFDRLPADELHRLGLPDEPGTNPRAVISNVPALAADAWMLLTDRVYFPFVPDRPYGVMVYDLIQERAPELFPPSFFPHHVHGIKPTIRQARRVVVTNPVTKEDVLRHVRPDETAVPLVPVACEPHLRFAGVNPGSS